MINMDLIKANADIGIALLEAYQRIDALEEEIRMQEATEDLNRRADQRAIARWQEATGRTMVWPDRADLCVFLMERIDELEKGGQK